MTSPIPYVPPEVWSRIIGHARNPVPTPRSRPLRSSLRQPELCALMRASRLFHALTEPVLYAHIVTDSFPHFILSCLASPHQRERLRRTRSLHLEYTPLDPESAGEALLTSGDPRERSDRQAASLIAACTEEIQLLRHCLKDLLLYGMKDVFPGLETVAVDSIYAHADDRRSDYRNSGESMDGLGECTRLFGLWMQSGDLKHLCVRDSSGPLAIDNLGVGAAGLTSLSVDYTRTVHFTASADGLSLPLAGKIRRIWDARPEEDFSAVIHRIAQCCDRLIQARVLDGIEREYQHRSPSFCEVDIYCSTERCGPGIHHDSLVKLGFGPVFPDEAEKKAGLQALPRGEQEEMVAVLQNRISELFGRRFGNRDKFRWMTSAETPVCEACGSGVPN